MLLGERRLRIPEYGIASVDRYILHSRFRLIVKDRHGIMADDALRRIHARPLPTDRTFLVLQLQGTSVFRGSWGAIHLRPGLGVLSHRNSRVNCRLEEGSRTVLLEWEAGSLGTREPAHEGLVALSRASLHRLRRLLARVPLKGQDPAIAAAALAELLAILRADGLPVDPVEGGDLLEKPPAAFAELTHAIDDVLSALGERHAALDLERRLGWPRSTLHRVLSRFQEVYAFSAVGGWRPLRQTWVLPSGIKLMSAPGMTTERAAQLLGYASPQAFCKAFAAAGLPSPGRIREALRQI